MVCQCICHESSGTSTIGMGIKTHADRCICNGGAGFDDLSDFTIILIRSKNE
jgi:hypothetical protein